MGTYESLMEKATLYHQPNPPQKWVTLYFIEGKRWRSHVKDKICKSINSSELNLSTVETYRESLLRIYNKHESRKGLPNLTHQDMLRFSGTKQIRQGLSPKQKKVTETIKVCKTNQCGHYGAHKYADKTVEGCGLLPIAAERPPCQVWEHVYNGGGCPADPPIFGPIERNQFIGQYVSFKQLHKDIAEFASSLMSRKDITAIAGVPRSGLMVASELSIRLGLPLYTLGENGLQSLLPGLRVRHKQENKGKTLIVEDSTASGRSIKEAKELIGSREDILYGCIYAADPGRGSMDLYHKELQLPHWFEWNLFGNSYLLTGMKGGTDFDGILCPDCLPEDDDDGDRYINWMKNVPCQTRIGPETIPYIITARLEQYRSITEEWLSKHQIAYKNLVMGPWKNINERSKVCIGSWKAEMMKQHDVYLFIESDPQQASIITKITPRPVICPALGTSLVSGVGYK